MSVQANEQWFATSHHELGHIYYFLSYSRPEVPFLLREGANRAFHEAIGELAKLASQQTPYLTKIGVIPRGQGAGRRAAGCCSRRSIRSSFLPWSAGTMSHFERDLYETELPPADWQGKWWEYVAEFQGVTPPGGRDPELCDACTKTHINDDAAEYYDYALATLIKFQLHDHICTKILKQDVRACDYSGNKEVGAFLKGILSLGATRDWRQGHQGRDRRVDLAAGADGVLRAAGRGPREAQRRKGLRALMAAHDQTGRTRRWSAAAEAFDETLQRFAALANGLRKGSLDSQRNLERAAEALKRGRRLRGRAAGARPGADGGAGERARRAAGAGRDRPRARAGDPGAQRGAGPTDARLRGDRQGRGGAERVGAAAGGTQAHARRDGQGRRSSWPGSTSCRNG